MKITYTQFAADPALRGTTTNLPAHIAQVLIAQGVAEAVPDPRRGTNEYLQMRAEQSAAAVPSPYDTPAPFVQGVRWEVGQSHFGRPVIMRRSGSETWQADFNVIPPDCPADIRKQYEGVVRQYLATFEANEREKAKAHASLR
jgi:hypothetical protein